VGTDGGLFMNIRLSAGEDPIRFSKPPSFGAVAIPGQPTEQPHHPAKPSGHRAEESRVFPTSSSYLTFWCQMAT
jgi:hypothetical protein